MQKQIVPTVEISFKCNHHHHHHHPQNDQSDENKPITFTIPSSESESTTSAASNMDEIRKKVQSSSSWKHDHGDLPELQLKQPYLDILLSLIEAKNISDEYLTKQIQRETLSNTSSTLEMSSSSSQSKSKLNSVQTMAEVKVNKIIVDDTLMENEEDINIDGVEEEDENTKRSRIK